MRDLLVALMIFGSLPVILVKPHVGVLVWSWISYMNPHRLTWGFAYDLRFALIVGAVTLFAWLVSREPKRLPWHPVTLLFVAFTAWISFTTLFALFPDHAAAKWDRVMKILLFNGFLTLGLITTKRRLNALIWVIVVSIGFYGIRGGIFTLLTGGNYHVFGPAKSFIADNNSLGLALLMVIPLMRYLQLSTEQRWVKWGLATAMLLSVVAILGTQSRGALVGLGVTLLALLIKSRNRLVIGTCLVLTLALGVLFMPEKWQARMETIVAYEEDASVQGRFDAWAYAIDTAIERPLTGGGFAAFRGNRVSTSAGYRAAHSIYFEVLGEQGIIGLALFLLLGAGALLTGRSTIRRTRDRPDLVWARDLAAMTQVCLVAYATSGLFLSLAFFDLFYHIVAVMVLTNASVTQELSASTERPPADPRGRSKIANSLHATKERRGRSHSPSILP